MERDELIQDLWALAPEDLAEDYDIGRIGLVVEGKDEVRKVCAALDATPSIVEDAISEGADMLVVHHTPIWTPLTRIRGRIAGLLGHALSSGLNIYVMHTNLDRAPGGINDCLADLLGLSDRVSMSIGVVGNCNLSPRKIFDITSFPLRVYGNCTDISRLAVVGGSGFDTLLFSEALQLGADAFLSAELKHSVALEAPFPCLEATHQALEALAMKQFAGRMGWTFLEEIPRFSTVP
jgi:dinuclear metal center YbgI/SA1388 family protein